MKLVQSYSVCFYTGEGEFIDQFDGYDYQGAKKDATRHSKEKGEMNGQPIAYTEINFYQADINDLYTGKGEEPDPTHPEFLKWRERYMDGKKTKRIAY